MTYLERLRNRQSGINHPKKSSQLYSEELTELIKAPFDSFVSSPGEGTQLFLGAKVGKVEFQLPAGGEPKKVRNSLVRNRQN